MIFGNFEEISQNLVFWYQTCKDVFSEVVLISDLNISKCPITCFHFVIIEDALTLNTMQNTIS